MPKSRDFQPGYFSFKGAVLVKVVPSSNRGLICLDNILTIKPVYVQPKAGGVPTVWERLDNLLRGVILRINLPFNR